MPKNFDNPLRQPLFSAEAPDQIQRQILRLHQNGTLSIRGGNTHRIYFNTNDTFWTRQALDEAIAALLHIRQEWREELEARGAVLPEDWPLGDLEEEDGDEDEEAPVEPAERTMEDVQRAHDEMVRAAGLREPERPLRWEDMVRNAPPRRAEPEENDPNF